MAMVLDSTPDTSWKVLKCSDLIESIKSGVSVNSTDRPKEAGELGILKTSAVFGGRYSPSENKVIETPEDVSRAKLNPKSGCLLVSRMNTPDLVGSTAFIEQGDESLFIPDRLWQIELKQEYQALWLYYVLNTHYYRHRLKVLANGTSDSMKNISKQSFLSLKVVVPSRSERERIGEILSTWDEAIELTQKLIDQLKLRKKGLMQQLLTGKKRLPGFEGEWEEVHLGDVIEEYSQKSTEQNQHVVMTSSRNGLVKQSDYFGEGRITERSNVGFHVIPPDYITYRSRSDDGRYTFNVNDMGITGVISHYYPVFRLRCGNNRFFVFFSEVHWHKFSRFGVGTSQQVLSLKAIKSMKVLFPPATERRAIQEVLEVVDSEIGLNEEYLTSIRLQKKGLMQQLLTGKTRVPLTEAS